MAKRAGYAMIITGKLDNPQPFGPYVLRAKIASGGMATVFLAEALSDHKLHGRPLAIKLLHPHLAENEDFVRMFADEGHVAKEFDHPNVVRVLDVGCVDGNYYIAMEYVEGRDLAQIIGAVRLNKTLVSVPVAFEILRQTLTALTYVHSFRTSGGRKMSIVHRDISPQNILISRHPLIKLTDFGIARGDHRSDRTATGTVKGKMHYMAPEQAAGERVDLRADLYAVGAVAFEMLTGKPAFTAEKTSVLHRKAMAGEVDLDDRKFTTQPDDVKAWLLKALAKDPAERFQSADAMLAAMELIGRANRNAYKPEHLQRLLDLNEARRSVQNEARARELFIGEDAADLKAGASAPRLRLNPSSVVSDSKVRGPLSHVDLGTGERHNRLLDRKPTFDERDARPPVDLRPSSAASQVTVRPQGRAAAEMLPAELVVGKSYAASRPSAEQRALAPVSLSSPKNAAVAAVTASGVHVLTGPASQTGKRPGISKITRAELDRERGAALATASAWMCGAFMSFAVLLEVVGWTPELPVLDERSVAELIGETPAKLDASAGSPAHPAAPVVELPKPVVAAALPVTSSPTDAPAASGAAAAANGAESGHAKRREIPAEELARNVMDARPLEKVVPYDAPEPGEKAAKAQARKKPAVAVNAGDGDARAAVPAKDAVVAKSPMAAAKPALAVAAKPVAAPSKPVAVAGKPSQAAASAPSQPKPMVAAKAPVAPGKLPAIAAARPSLPAAKAAPLAAPKPASAAVAVAGKSAPAGKSVSAGKSALAGKSAAGVPVAAAKSAMAAPRNNPGKPAIAAPTAAGKVAPAAAAKGVPAGKASAPAAAKPAVPGKAAIGVKPAPAAGPVRPSALAKPVAGAKPAIAAKPAVAAKPVVGAKPAIAAKPAAAAKPAVAAKPVAGAKPVVAVKPAVAAKPVVGAKPSAPAKPSVPGARPAAPPAKPPGPSAKPPGPSAKPNAPSAKPSALAAKPSAVAAKPMPPQQAAHAAKPAVPGAPLKKPVGK